MAVSSGTRARGGRRAAKGTAATTDGRGARQDEPGVEQLLDLYRKMILIRLFEDATGRGFRQGKIGGYLHVYSGQEAIATGFLASYRPGDVVITAYRDHAHALLLGSDP
ncbi:MAG TPA: thiamine pyrophosphate-dependent enzyme, partial [Thermomicrobiales bacterium]|nr:thiamine pyrophosphate-dependent enzyme [Thermomicrobiales bacterium]